MNDPEQAEEEHRAFEHRFPPRLDRPVRNRNQRNQDYEAVENKRIDKGRKFAALFGSRQIGWFIPKRSRPVAGFHLKIDLAL